MCDIKLLNDQITGLKEKLKGLRSQKSLFDKAEIESRDRIKAVAERLADKDVLRSDVVESFQAILQAFKDADCGSCMARLVVLREMKKFKKEG